MKRFTLILALVLMVAMPSFAEHVSSATAQKAAATFLNNNGAKSTQITDLSKEVGFQNLYIFTTEQSFVVMSADDRVQPILGYSLAGNFIPDDMPDNVRGWLQGYNDEIQFAIDNQMKATPKSTQLWKDLLDGNSKAAKVTSVVAPLIQTKWNQNKYYNNLCPQVSDGPENHAYTGCVATAMAQIMKYWEYPSHGIGSHSYTWNNQILSADYSTTTYDWDNMTNYYNYYYSTGTGSPTWLSNPSTEQITAVATLLYHCGVSVNMKYGGSASGGSSATTAHVVYALKNYFNYSSDIEYKTKADYEDEWITMVKAELDASRPLQYRGSTTGGHSFVCDGYNNDDYFHFNWGWSGAYDGYFSLDNLDTGANNQSGQGNGIYTDNQAAIFGIRPSQSLASEPLNLTYTLNGLQNLTLNWTVANGAVSYNIYRNGNYVGSSDTNSFSEAVHFGSHVYYVRSVDANGELSLSSNNVVVTVEFQTPTVVDLEASLSGNDASLTWSAPAWCYPETESDKLNFGEGDSHYSWTSVYYGHRHLANDLAQYAGKAVYKISTFISYPGTYSLYIYTKTNQNDKPDPNYLAFYTEMPVSIFKDWYEFDIDEPIILTGTDDLWVVIKQENTGQYYPTPSFDLDEYNANACYRSSASPTNLSPTQNNYSISWFINTYLTDGIYTYNLYQDGTQIAEGLNQTTYNASLNDNSANLFSVKTNYYGGETDASNKIGFAKGNASLSSFNMATNDKMTVTEGSKLTVSGTLSNENTANLILENGAQLVNNSNGVQATVRKNTTAYTQEGGWYLIASPITEDITPSINNGLLSNNYDLYTFNQSEELEWRNYEAQNFNICNKTGYLYANSGSPTLTFAGTLAASEGSTSLTYVPNVEFSGFNLIGNPYPCNTYVDRSFYVLNEDGSDFILGSSPIPPCSAILVQAQGTGESVAFSKTASKSEPNIAISVAKANMKGNAIIDKARVSFNEKDQLEKYTMSDQSSRLYIPQNGNDFAVAFADNQIEMPINFKVAHDGTYSIYIEIEDLELDYLHLIDNFTGNDVDLLTTPSYAFEAKTSDYASRFKLVFDKNGSSAGSETFAYMSDGNIIINTAGEATLQIVDIMGRVVMEENAMNCVSTNGLTSGVYVLRLINGEKVQTQKIVIE